MKRLHSTIEKLVYRGIAKYEPALFRDFESGFFYEPICDQLLFTTTFDDMLRAAVVAYSRSEARRRYIWREFFTPDGKYWMKTVGYGTECLNYVEGDKFKRYLLDIQALRRKAKESLWARMRYWKFTGWWVK